MCIPSACLQEEGKEPFAFYTCCSGSVESLHLSSVAYGREMEGKVTEDSAGARALETLLACVCEQVDTQRVVCMCVCVCACRGQKTTSALVPHSFFTRHSSPSFIKTEPIPHQKCQADQLDWLVCPRDPPLFASQCWHFTNTSPYLAPAARVGSGDLAQLSALSGVPSLPLVFSHAAFSLACCWISALS